MKDYLTKTKLPFSRHALPFKENLQYQRYPSGGWGRRKYLRPILPQACQIGKQAFHPGAK
jgi:hypothetical protein